MKRDPISAVWLAGLALAVLFYLLDPGRVAEQLGVYLSWFASRADLMFAEITFAAADMVRAVALALYAVFCLLCLLSVRRGAKGRAALVLVSLAFLALVALDDGGPDERRWGEALLLAGVGAIVMTRRVRGRCPPGCADAGPRRGHARKLAVPNVHLCSAPPHVVNGPTVQGVNDQADALGVPALNRFVVGAQRCGKPAPGEQVPLRHRTDQGAGADDPPQHVPVRWDAGDPRQCLVHPRDAARARHRRPDPARWRGERLHGVSHHIQHAGPQPGGVACPRQCQERGAGFLQPVDRELAIDGCSVGSEGIRSYQERAHWPASEASRSNTGYG